MVSKAKIEVKQSKSGLLDFVGTWLAHDKLQNTIYCVFIKNTTNLVRIFTKVQNI